MENKIINLGIFGFGVVGQGLYEVLNRTKGINARIKKICIKDPNKSRPIDSSYFTTDKNEILEDPTIDVVVELINDTEAAFEIVSTALRNGKAVVSASKRMIAENLPALYQAAGGKTKFHSCMKPPAAPVFPSSATWKNTTTTICSTQ